MTEDTLIDKITKLLAKAERAGTPEEAEAFAAKATELMMKHSIDEAMIAARRPGESSKIGRLRINVRGSYWQAHRDLAFGIGKAFGCKLLQGNGGYAVDGKKIAGYAIIVGFEDDLKLIEQLYASLLIQQTRALDSFKRSVDLSHYSGMEKFIARRSFCFGFADEVGRRLEEQRKNAAAEAESTNTTGTSVALVLASRSDMLEKAYAEMYPRRGKARGGSIRWNGGAASQGKAAGARADIGNRGVSGARGTLGR